MASILISYRRADSQAITGRIHDRLAMYFGTTSVFMDIDSIPLGVDFRKQLTQEISKHDFVLVVVGPNWRGVREGKPARIFDATDPVRLEVETALACRCRTIPVFVDHALMPNPDDLPKELEPFCSLNGATVDAGVDFHTHMERLIREIVRLDRAARPPKYVLLPLLAKYKTLRWVAASVAGLCILAGAVYPARDRLFPSSVKDAAVFLLPPSYRLADDAEVKEKMFRAVWSHFISGLTAQKKFAIIPTQSDLQDGSSGFHRTFYGPEIAGRIVLAQNLAAYGDAVGRRIEFVARCDVYLQGPNVRLVMELETFDGAARSLSEVADTRTEISGLRTAAEALAMVASYDLVSKFLMKSGLSTPAIEETVARQFITAARADPVRSQINLAALPDRCTDFACMASAREKLFPPEEEVAQAEAAQANVNAVVEAGRLAKGVQEQ